MNVVEMTRVFEAPREMVFRYWSTAASLQRWSGCKEAARCEVEMDFRVGGGFTQKMWITGVGEFTLAGTYEEIIAPERIVYSVEIGKAVTRVTVEFHEHGKGTKMTLRHEELPDEFHCNTVSQGTRESLDKLETLLAEQTVGSGE